MARPLLPPAPLRAATAAARPWRRIRRAIQVPPKRQRQSTEARWRAPAARRQRRNRAAQFRARGRHRWNRREHVGVRDGSRAYCAKARRALRLKIVLRIAFRQFCVVAARKRSDSRFFGEAAKPIERVGGVCSILGTAPPCRCSCSSSAAFRLRASGRRSPRHARHCAAVAFIDFGKYSTRRL